MSSDPKTVIRAHQYLYYVLVRPVISDYDYDMMCARHGIEGGGGSDLASSYSEEEVRLAKKMLEGEKGVDERYRI